MTSLLIATTNKGKLREIQELLKDFPIKVTCLSDHPKLPEVIEDGKTFEANAIKKARETGKHTGVLVIGEDSGLEVDALNGEPGIYSARFAATGPGNAADKDNNSKLLRVLKNVPHEKRTARYRCAAALSGSAYQPADAVTVGGR